AVQRKAGSNPSSGASASVSRSSIEFPATRAGGRASAVDVMVTNRGAMALPVEDIAIVPPIANDPFPIYAAQQTLQPGERLNLQVGFAPRKAGSYTERLHVLTSGGVSVAHVDLVGRGLDAAADDGNKGKPSTPAPVRPSSKKPSAR